MTRGIPLRAKGIATFLNARLFGEDIAVETPVPIHQLRPGTLSFAATFDSGLEQEINKQPSALVIVNVEYKGKLRSPHILSDDPRLDFLRVLKEFFAPAVPVGIHELANVHPNATLGKKVTIGSFSVVGPDVEIGDECIIRNGVVICGPTRLGRRCEVKSNAVIGEQGFGFAYDEFGRPEHFPHIGRIEIGDDVWIGACSTVERATIDATVIESNVKIDDLVQIGHNSRIGRNTLVMASSVVCGGAVIGEGCWIAPNTVIKEKVTLGANAYTGLGAVIINDVPPNTVVVGNPARRLRERA
jgi:UDP-3-O-[3-hydroxymyristoyl] glucosamine N-acyltransferase